MDTSPEAKAVYEMFSEQSLLMYDNIITRYNQEYLFDEATDDLERKIIACCSSDVQRQYQQLLEEEAANCSPIIQNMIAELLLTAANKYREITCPNAPACQIFMEVYRRPALRWASKAVLAKHIPAYHTEYKIVDQGAKDVECNSELSRALIIRAASLGDAKAMLSLAFESNVNPKFKSMTMNLEHSFDYNPLLAEYLYERVEEQNDPETYPELASYYRGKGNIEREIYYYTELVSRGNYEFWGKLIGAVARSGDIDDSRRLIKRLLQTEDGNIIYKAYSALKYHELDIINDIQLEVDILQCAIKYKNAKAEKTLKEEYTKTLLGKWKRTKKWSSFS